MNSPPRHQNGWYETPLTPMVRSCHELMNMTLGFEAALSWRWLVFTIVSGEGAQPSKAMTKSAGLAASVVVEGGAGAELRVVADNRRRVIEALKDDSFLCTMHSKFRRKVLYLFKIV